MESECTLREIQAQMDSRFFSWDTFHIMKRQARSYSIVDHELLRGGYLGRLTHQALALYLFLVVVGDWAGKNFYSASSIGKILRMDFFEICRAKEELCMARLIDYKKPYWRVMTLTYGKRSAGSEALNPLVKQVLESKEITNA